MLILKSLTFSGIGRFVDEQTVDFTMLGSLVQVDGQNNNTGGSSGSGKSTVFKALEFLLGLNDISNGVLQSRLTKEAMSVAGLFDFDGLTLKIQRNKKLSIDLDGEVTTGSSKLTEEKLDEIIGMPRDLFRRILHKRQGEGGFFLDMGPSEVHKFLTDCQGLEKEQAKIIVLDSRLETLLETETSLKWTLDANKMGVEATQSAIASLGPSPVLEIDPETVERLRNEYAAVVNKHNLIKTAHEIEMGNPSNSRPQIASVPFDRTRIEQLENEVGTLLANIAKLDHAEIARQASLSSKIAEFQILERKIEREELARQSEVRSRLDQNKLEMTRVLYTRNDGDKAKIEAAELVKELQKIRASICPTCDQSWVTDAAKAKEASLLQKLQEYKKLVIAGMEADKKGKLLGEERQILGEEAQTKRIPESISINEQIAQLTLQSQPQAIPEAIELKLKIDFKNKEFVAIRQEERDHQFNENAKSQAILVAYEQKQTDLRKYHEVIIRDVQDEEYRALSAYNIAKSKVSHFEENKKRFDESLGKLESQADRYQVLMYTLDTELSLILEEIELAQESKKAIKSYLSCSFEDALDSIGDTATRLIRSIPNMATATIQFEGLKETKEGKIREEVTCIVSMDGEIGIPVKSLSGGERSSTDLAIDLSVIKFIEERTGKGIDLFVLDEPFTGLDTTNVFEALEMLKECSVDKRLLIVDHNPVASQSIESRLTVVRDGLTSKIVQQ